MLRVDLDAREVAASVRELAQSAWEFRSVDGPLGHARALLGSQVHRDYRSERERTATGFTAEVGIAGEQEVDDFVIRLRGRIDGILESDRELCRVYLELAAEESALRKRADSEAEATLCAGDQQLSVFR